MRISSDDRFEKNVVDLILFQVLTELTGDRSLEKFRLEYEKLHKALKKSHESERRLMQKCRELNAEIVANSAKVATALKLSQEDQATIASLKKVSAKVFVIETHCSLNNKYRHNSFKDIKSFVSKTFFSDFSHNYCIRI